MKQSRKRIIWFICALVFLGNIKFANATITSEIETLLNWAENTYPELFPNRRGTQTLEPWVYRFYPDAGIYVGVNKSDNSVYVMGGQWGNNPVFIDSLSNMNGVIESSDSHGDIAACNTQYITGSTAYSQNVASSQGSSSSQSSTSTSQSSSSSQSSTSSQDSSSSQSSQSWSHSQSVSLNQSVAYSQEQSYGQSVSYSQSGNIVTVSTVGECIEAAPATHFCEVPVQSTPTDISVLSTGSITSSEWGGLSLNTPIDTFDLLDVSLKTCTMNAPAEQIELVVNMDLCFDMTAQVESLLSEQDMQGAATIDPPVSLSYKSTYSHQVVTDCFATEAERIYDAFTDEVWIKQNEDFVKVSN